MSERIAWGRWDCTRCGAANISGEHKRCPTCGDPREQHELDAMRPPSAADFAHKAVSDPEGLALAKSGRDWICGYCGTTNRGTDGACASCSGARPVDPGVAQDAGQTAAPVTPVKVVPKAPARRRASYWRRSSRARKVWTVVGGLATAVIAYLWWGSLTHETLGAVTSLHWKHVTERQRWGDVATGQWGRPVEQVGVPPVAGAGEQAGVHVTSCYSKYHSDEQYECGTETYETSESYSCGSEQQCSTVNNGNGSFSERCTSVTKTCTRPVTATRTRYCTRPVYRDWCDYTTQQWLVVETAVREAEGHTLTWATLTAVGDSERIERHSTYSVVCGLEDDSSAFTHEVSADDYAGFKVGDKMVLTVKNRGGVTAARRAE